MSQITKTGNAFGSELANALTDRDVICEPSADGGVLVRTTQPLGRHPWRVTEPLARFAAATPDQVFIAARSGDGWRKLTYREALAGARAIAQALLDRGLWAERPVLILSGNSIEHALLALGCLYAGIPFAPISTAYSLVSTDFARLRQIVSLLRPGLIFADDGAAYASALERCAPDDAEIVVATGSLGREATRFDSLLATSPTAAVDVANGKIVPDTIAKLLFTSGSTGFPKGVIHTQYATCAVISMVTSAHPIVGEAQPVMVDWLPWSHVMGGSVSFSIPLFHGGTLYIDDGKPLPGQIEKTARNLREVAPSLYLSVPKGYEELLQILRRDEPLRQTFFGNVRLLQYSGASIPQHVFDGFEELARATIGRPIPWLAALGSTEAGLITSHQSENATETGNIGLPAPGVTLKLAPVDGKWEARVKSPTVTPGYWMQDDLTEAAFDDEGFFRLGDALTWIDPKDPRRGLRYDGRIAEDFKLITGTWVRAGLLRAHLLAHLASELRDVVIAGENREFIAVLGIPADPSAVNDEAMRDRLQTKLTALAGDAGGSARRVLRFAFLTARLSIDTGELTDKGAISQRTILRRHADAVDALYADPPAEHVICVEQAYQSAPAS